MRDRGRTEAQGGGRGGGGAVNSREGTRKGVGLYLGGGAADKVLPSFLRLRDSFF